MPTPFTNAGIVLAAGASRRMGYPKALLPLPHGTLLAVDQMQRLRGAGCARVVVVVGAHAEAIAKKITEGEVVKHADWEQGRLTSLQAGLRALPGFDGYLILPVDTVGVQVETLARLLTSATRATAALRPFVDGSPGRVLWISADVAQALLALPAQDINLEAWLGERVEGVPMDDAAVRNNINTPDDWAAVRVQL